MGIGAITLGVPVRKAVGPRKRHTSDVHAVWARRCACVVDTQLLLFPRRAALNIVSGSRHGGAGGHASNGPHAG